jgi:leucyl-tRNA synthetase
VGPGRSPLLDYEEAGVDSQADRALRRKTHQVIRKVSEDLESFSFNTAVAAIMEQRNALQAAQREQNVSRSVWDEAVQNLLLVLAPMAPHITEELWSRHGKPYSIHQQAWPTWDPEIAKEETITLIVQINGRVRDRLSVPAVTPDEELQKAALASDKVKRHLDGKEPRKVIVVKGKLVNIVV